jgi:hypothetical protein
MRPFGHTEAREERDDHIMAIPSPLQEAWERYPPVTEYTLHQELLEKATSLLRPLRPTLEQLHRHVFATPHHDDARAGAHLGLFITAGYQLLQQKTIVFPLAMPHLHCLGWRLRNKHLVIDGVVGRDCGRGSMGDLTINGRAHARAGEAMIGRFTNNGETEMDTTFSMIGVYTGQPIAHPELLLGSYNGAWNIAKERHRPFLRDIRYPHNTPYWMFYEKIHTRYSMWKVER